MQRRPTLTIKLRNGDNYDANHLAVVQISPTGYRLAFESSGVINQVDPAEVAGIEFSTDGAVWCPWCDGRISD